MYLFISIFYRLILWAVSPILFIFILIHSLFSPIQFIPYLYKTGILIPKVLKTKPIIWIHGVSAGEVASIQGIATLLRDQYHLFITSSTISGWIIVQKLYPSDTLSFFPLDYPIIYKRLLKRIEPKAILFIEGEIWPNILKESIRQGIPCFLLSGRLSDKEFKGYFKLKAFFGEVFNCFKVLSMQSEEDCRKACDLGVEPSKVFMGGNLKFDLKIDSSISQRHISLWQKDSFILIAASTHRGEEAIILKTYENLQHSFPNLKLVIAPRHPERSDSIANIANKLGLNPMKWSKYRELDPPEPINDRKVLILDTMGELTCFYPIAHLVLLAGSFVKGIGGHNPVEPAYFAKPIITGPYTHNFNPMIGEMLSKSAIIQLENTGEPIGKALVSTIEKMILDPHLSTSLGDKAKDFISKHRGSSLRTFNAIKSYLSH